MAGVSRDLLIEIIKQVGLGINFCRSYPKGHPGLEPIIAKTLELVKEIPQEKEEIAMCLIENVVLFEGERFESDKLPIVRSMGNVFSKLGVRSISLSVDATSDDLKAFFYTMAASQADLQDYGSISAIIQAQGTDKITLNELEYGVVSSKGGKVKIDWEVFLRTLHSSNILISEDDTKKELVNFLTDVVGLKGGEPEELQADMIVNTLEKLSNLVVEKFGAESWGEYSLVFTRILATLSPNIKSRVGQIKTENRRLAELIRNILPTLNDETLIEIITARTLAQPEDRPPDPDVIEVLKKLTGPRLVNLLPQLKGRIPTKALDEVTMMLGRAASLTDREKKTEEVSREELEKELRKFFPLLREPVPEKQIKAIDDIMDFAGKLIGLKRVELVKLIVDRFDSMSDGEKSLVVFSKLMESLKELYFKARSGGMRDIYDTISKRMGKHLLRTGKDFIERKKVVIHKIGEMHDTSYVTDLVSILWEPGSFNEAREALVRFGADAVEPLIGVLKDAEDRSVRMKILDVLLTMGKVVIPSCIKLLSDPEWFVRRNGIYILGELKVEEVTDDVGKMVGDVHEFVQREAVHALGVIGGAKARPHLQAGLKSKYKLVVLEAMRYLPREDIRPVMADIVKLLERRKRIPEKKEEELRRHVLEALGRVGDDDIIESLLLVVRERSFIGGDLLLGTKEAAVDALGKLGTPKALEALNGLAASTDAEAAGLAEAVLEKLKREAARAREPEPH